MDSCLSHRLEVLKDWSTKSAVHFYLDHSGLKASITLSVTKSTRRAEISQAQCTSIQVTSTAAGATSFDTASQSEDT